MTPEQVIKASPLFSEADDAAIHFIASAMKTVTYKKGDPIALENEISDHVYFVKSGSVEIVKYKPELQQVHRITILKAGAIFSEFSVLNHSFKSASVFAFEDTELYRMDGEVFLKILVKFPLISRKVVSVLAETNLKFAGSNAFIQHFDRRYFSYHAQIEAQMPPPLWKKFGVLPLYAFSNSILIAAKDPHKSAFIEYCQTHLSRTLIHVTLIGEQEFDSLERELASLYAKKNPTPVQAEVVSSQETTKSLMLKSPYFAGLPEKIIDQILPHLQEVTLAPGELLYEAGSTADVFYVVLTGGLILSRHFNKNATWSHVCDLNAREGISDVALLTNQPYFLSARANSNSRILKVHKKIFTQLLGSGTFCLNVAKVLARRLQLMSDSSGIKPFDNRLEPDLLRLGSLIPKSIMQQHQIIPLLLSNNEITLGVVNPSNEGIYSVVSRYLRGYRINLEWITQEHFRKWIALVKEPQVVQNTQAQTSRSVGELDKVLTEGFSSRASDVHIESFPAGYIVRYRVDGVLSEAGQTLPREVGEGMVNRIKVMSQLDISNHMTPQDGQLKMTVNEETFTARVSTVPAKHGENAVLRLIRNRNSVTPLSMLAPDPRTIRVLKTISKYKQGLFLVTGPTGSGKTTTLYSLIAELNRVDIKILSIEDPVELEIPGTTQIEISEKTGLTFSKALLSTLRQDPDVVIVGEIRDAESAKIVFEAALSGHLVISTLHTNSAFGVRNRLKELGVPLGTMAAGLVGSMAQRLVRASCKKCRTPRPTTDAEKHILKERLRLEKAPEELMASPGCSHCKFTGFFGRLPIIEVWHKNREMEDLLANDATTEEFMAAARKDGYDTLTEFGLKMAINGLTTVEEIERCMAGASE